jgi:pimeloyl-ACP methyl ester carboxylesterase
VLVLDWSAAADTGLCCPTAAEDGIVPVAQWAANALLLAGFVGTNLNLVGHSFGSYVADEIAHRIPGGVDTIVGLDPALDAPGGSYSPVANDEVDFARDSEFSWAFHASSFGNDFTPTTADEAFIVNSGLNIASAHSAVVFLFAYFVLHPEDPSAQLFLVSSLLSAAAGPWLPNQYASSFFGDQGVAGYEAVITTSSDGTRPTNVEYVPRPRLVVLQQAGLLTVSWPTNYSTFALESSPNVGPAAQWQPVSPAPSVEGASNVLSMREDLNRFFRLKQK